MEKIIFGNIIDTQKEKKFFLTTRVGDATINKKYKVELLVGTVNLAPKVKYGNKYFSLGWDDILQLAENAGLFEEEKEEGSAIKKRLPNTQKNNYIKKEHTK